MDSFHVRRGSTSMEPMSSPRASLLGPLTRSEEILQFERLRHQLQIVEALRGLKITTPVTRTIQSLKPPMPWRKLKTVNFSDLVMDKVHDGCMIKCRTVVEPLVFGSLQVLVEEIDGGFKVMMAAIDNFVNQSNIMELGVLFPVGRELWIRNPSIRAHEGRPIIRVEDPINLKLRQTSREIERILEYGPADAEGWRIKGKELVKRGRLAEAVDSFRSGISQAEGNIKLKSSLLRWHADALYRLGKFQAARLDAAASLALVKKDKTHFLLAKILLELRSYSAALGHIRQMSERDADADLLFRQLLICDIEYHEGKYNTILIAEEAHLNDRVVHADYVSPKIELRAAGVDSRGMFAKEKLGAGTLLVASKAIVCIYVDEIVNKHRELEDDEEEEEGKGLFDAIREEFVNRLIKILNNGSARRILQLAGGSQSLDTSMNLRRDDVYDNGFHFLPAQVKEIVSRNSFGGAQRSQILSRAISNGNHSSTGGGALFYAPSFFNHSCVPNATYFTIGDMMFIKTNRDVDEGEELMIHYLYVEKLSEKERNETLQRVWEFTCQCELCEWERENEETCAAADKIMSKAFDFAKSATPDAAVKKFLSAVKKLYQLYRAPLPQIALPSALETPPPVSAPSLARYLVVVYRELVKVLRESTRNTDLSGPINGDYHFLLKAYSHYERIGIAGIPALRVWEYMYRNPSSATSAEIDAWLVEARESHDVLLGDGHFEYQHGQFISEPQKCHVCIPNLSTHRADDQEIPCSLQPGPTFSPSFILPKFTMKFKGFTVTVNSGPNSGVPGTRRSGALMEYPPKDPVQDYIVSAYIASQAGQRFTISVKNECGHDASVVFYVDGQMASVLLCYAVPAYNAVICHGVQPEAGCLRRFIFNKATLTDEAKQTSPDVRGKDVGTIRVVIRRCVVKAYDAKATFMQVNTTSPVHEKTEKGLLDTRIGLQAPEPYSGGPYANVEYFDKTKPWVEFTFIYKSYDLLQALGITPPIAKVPSFNACQKRPSSDEDSLREEIDLSRLQRQKTEPLESSNSMSLKTRKVMIKKEIEVIDLTED